MECTTSTRLPAPTPSLRSWVVVPWTTITITERCAQIEGGNIPKLPPEEKKSRTCNAVRQRRPPPPDPELGRKEGKKEEKPLASTSDALLKAKLEEDETPTLGEPDHHHSGWKSNDASMQTIHEEGQIDTFNINADDSEDDEDFPIKYIKTKKPNKKFLNS